MPIKIADPLKPYSQNPGISFLLPGSYLRAQIFPALINIDDLSGSIPQRIAEIPLNIKGPLSNFIAMQDLDRGHLRVWGDSLDGFVRYRIQSAKCGTRFAIIAEKKLEDLKHEIGDFNADELFSVKAPFERLSLGSHKSLDWTMMMRRKDFTEIFPIWLRLSQIIPSKFEEAKGGTTALLGACLRAINSNKPETILPQFLSLFLAGFAAGLSPHLEDEDHYGIELPEMMGGSPLTLLHQGGRLIRQLFLFQEAQSISILPHLPPEFHSGRLIHADCGPLGSIDIEWSKKSLRRVYFSAKQTGSISFIFPKWVKRFRFRDSIAYRGRVLSAEKAIDLVEGQNYWFDNFEH